MSYREYWACLKPGHKHCPPLCVQSDFIERDEICINEMKTLNLPLSAKILDVGCSSGRTLNSLAHHGYTHLTGLDINSFAIEHIHTIYPELNCKTIIGSMDNLPDEIFDVVITIATQLHLDDDDQTKFYQWLNTHAKFCIFLESFNYTYIVKKRCLFNKISAVPILTQNSFKLIKNDTIKKKSLRNYSIVVLKNCLYSLYSNEPSSTIVQLINPPDTRSLRCMLLPHKYYDIIYLVNESARNQVESNLVLSRLSPQIRFIKNGEFHSTIKELNPCAIIISHSPSKKVIRQYKYCFDRLYYLPHGLQPNLHFIVPIIRKSWNTTIRYFLSGVESQHTLNICGHNDKNIVLVNGLAQIDYIMENKQYLPQLEIDFRKAHNLTTNTKIIVLVNGSSKNRNKASNVDIVVDALDALGIDYFLIVKSKAKALRYPHDKVISLSARKFLYDYFFCDLLIVVEGGTSMLECFYAKPNATIIYKCYPIQGQFPEVVKHSTADNEDELQQQLKWRFVTGLSYEDHQILQQEGHNYVHTIIGGEMKPVSDYVLDIVTNNTFNKESVAYKNIYHKEDTHLPTLESEPTVIYFKITCTKL